METNSHEKRIILRLILLLALLGPQRRLRRPGWADRGGGAGERHDLRTESPGLPGGYGPVSLD